MPKICKKLNLVVILFFCLGSVYCSSIPSPPASHQAFAAEKKLVSSDNEFGFGLFKKVVQEEKDKNVVISPFSVSMALGMTYNGASGDTKKAMQKTLGLSGLTDKEINESYKHMVELLIKRDSKVRFQTANSIWHLSKYSFEKRFTDLNRFYFDSEVRGLDFTDPDAPKIINEWVDMKTHGKIKEIVRQSDFDQAAMFLINAVYFKGVWTHEFNKKSTKPHPFFLLDGSVKRCEMMAQERDFKYLRNRDFSAVSLPYGKGDFSMTILLPDTPKKMDSLIDGLNQNSWKKWVKSFSEEEMKLGLPKFNIEDETTLNEALKAMGMEVAFDPERADFTAMDKTGGLWIGAVRHKTYVLVNEEGTEASAATSVGIKLGIGPGEKTMLIDRPFIFVIHERDSGAILFIGKIVDPTSQ